EDGLTVLLKVVLEDAPRASELREDVPAALDDLLGAMISKVPGERPSDGDTAAVALRSLDLTSVPASGRPSRRSGGLTRDERRIVCLVMALPRWRGESEATVDARVSHVRHAVVEETTTRHQAKLERLADGSLAALLVGSGIATDLAARAARCALAMRTSLP